MSLYSNAYKIVYKKKVIHTKEKVLNISVQYFNAVTSVKKCKE